ncbi:MAG: bactofilin family protein [Magnetospiraceae bacterium]
MFSKGNPPRIEEEGKPITRPKGPAIPSVISPSARITGDIVSDGELQVDGVIDGDVRAEKLLVGDQAHITGQITADSVEVHGQVTGQIKARSVNLATSGKMVGDIHHETLSIDEGAFLEGHCKRIRYAEVISEIDRLPGDAKITAISEAKSSDS